MSLIFKLLTMPDLMYYFIPMLEYRDIIILMQMSMRAVSLFILFIKYGAYNKLVFRNRAPVLESVGIYYPLMCLWLAGLGIMKRCLCRNSSNISEYCCS